MVTRSAILLPHLNSSRLSSPLEDAEFHPARYTLAKGFTYLSSFRNKKGPQWSLMVETASVSLAVSAGSKCVTVMTVD